MIKNKGKLILSLSAALCACCVSGILVTATADNTPTVTFSDCGIEDTYVTNAVFETPKVVAYCDGAEYQTDCTIVFPDGKTVYSDLFVLEQSGTYSITYSAVIEGQTFEQTKEFITKDTSGNLFTLEKATVSFGEANFFEEVYGAEVNAEVGASITYNKVVNLSQNTKADELIELVATPHKQKSEDFSEMYVTLTDIYDAENFVSIKIYSAKDNSRYSSYVQAKAAGQRYCGLENGSPNFGITAGGLVIRHSFGAYYPEVEGNATHTVKLFYDNAERALYAKVGDMTQLVVDLDDDKYITKPWGGFSTGEVELKVTIGDVVGSPKFVIKSIDGNQLVDEYPVDVKEPTLICDIPAYIPMAVVGKQYPVFAFKAWDNYALAAKDVKVYYRYGTGNEVNVSVLNGGFVPNKVGEYTIVYTATDLAGNITEERVSVQACNESDITPLNISLVSNEAESKQLGENISLRSYEYSGGVGYEKVVIELRKNGSAVQTIDNNVFNVYEEGEYEVVYTISDYVGNLSTEKYSLTILPNTTPILLEEIVLPQAFVSGMSYALPQVNAYDYSNGEEMAIQPLITASINGADVSVQNGKITPQATNSGDKVTVSYKYVNKNGGETLWEKEVPVVIVKGETGALEQDKYFYTEGFTMNTQSDCVSMLTSQSGATATFVRPVQAKNLVLGIGYDNNQFTAEWFDVVISDKFMSKETVTVRIYKDGNVSINGGEKAVATVAKDTAKTVFTLNYDNETHSLSDATANVIGRVTTTANGEDFDGFTSDEVFVTIKMGDTAGESKLYCTLINNQPMSKSGRDNIVPQLYISSLVGGRSELGTIVKIYPAFAYDVLHDITSLTVTFRNLDTNETLKDVNGVELSEVSAEQEYQVCLENYGRYQVQYNAKDAAGKKVTATKIINVFDDQAPTITLNGTMPTSAKLNETITVPTYTVKDGQTEEVSSYLVAIAPNGMITYFNTQFTPNQVGNWRVCYFAMDANGQMATLEYVITVA